MWTDSRMSPTVPEPAFMATTTSWTSEDALGFPLSRVRDAGGVVQTVVGDQDVVLFATEAAGIRGFADPGYTFDRSGEKFVADGTTWDPAAGQAATGRQLDRLSTRRLFAFAWQDDHGVDAFYEPRNE